MKTPLHDVQPAPVSKPWKNRVSPFPLRLRSGQAILGTFALALLLGAGGAFAANTDGKVNFKATFTTPLSAGGYGTTAHCDAIWVENTLNQFIQTIVRPSANASDVVAYYAQRGSYTGYAVDGLSSATITGTKTYNLTWHFVSTNGATLPDGTFYIRCEYTNRDKPTAGPYTTNWCVFVKSPMAFTTNYANLSGSLGGQFTNLSLTWTPYAEIGVTGITPSAGLVNSNVAVQVAVTNQTLNALTYTVVVSNLTSAALIGTQTITAMPANSSTNVTLNWNTTGLAAAAYRLRAAAGPLATETNLTDNVRTNTITLTSTTVNDLAITAMAPATGFISSNVAVQVTVTNLTTNTASAVMLSLSNVTSAATFIATQQLATLVGRTGTNVTLTWSTAALTAGVYQLQAKVNPAVGEVVINNNLMTNAVTLRAAFHDLAVGAFTLAPMVPPARLTNVVVAVTNLGDFTETFAFTLTDLTAVQTIGTRGITNLAAAAMTNVSFAWNTTNAALTTHTLQAVAGPLAGELTTLNNTNTASVLVTAGIETNTLLARGSAWKYLDAGRDLSGAPWTKADFYDGTWSNGVAPLGYGLPNLVTTVGYGGNPANRNITTYFRREFFADSMNLAVTGRVLRTDGVVLYVNGAELARQNMASGVVSAATLATTLNTGAGATNYFGFTVPTNLLVTGRNLLAAEVHLASATSSAMGFDVQLTTQNPILPHTTNVAVSALQPDGAVQLGDRAGFTVTLTNKGDVSTAYTVLLKDLTTGAILASQAMPSLAVDEYTTINLAWSTFGALATDHALQAMTVVNGTTNVAGAASATQSVSAANFATQPVNATASIGGRCNAVAVSGGTVYLGCGATLEIWDTSTPTNPARRGMLRLPGNIEHLLVTGSLVLAAAGASGVHAVDVSTPDSPLYKGDLRQLRVRRLPGRGRFHSLSGRWCRRCAHAGCLKSQRAGAGRRLPDRGPRAGARAQRAEPAGHGWLRWPAGADDQCRRAGADRCLSRRNDGARARRRFRFCAGERCQWRPLPDQHLGGGRARARRLGAVAGGRPRAGAGRFHRLCGRRRGRLVDRGCRNAGDPGDEQSGGRRSRRCGLLRGHALCGCRLCGLPDLQRRGRLANLARCDPDERATGGCRGAGREPVRRRRRGWPAGAQPDEPGAAGADRGGGRSQQRALRGGSRAAGVRGRRL